MIIGQIIRCLHGKTYEVSDYKILGNEIPKGMIKEPSCLTSDTLEKDITKRCHFISIQDKVAIEYNVHYKVYIKYIIKFIKYEKEYDIRHGFTNLSEGNKNTKTTRSNRFNG